MSNLTGLENTGNLNVREYLNTFRNTMKEIQNPDKFTAPQGDLLKGGVSYNQIAGDPELANDLSILTGGKSSGKVNNQDSAAHQTVESFSNILGNYITDVNTKQKESEKAVETFSSGGDIDIHNVMVAMEKSSLSMQLTLQMRNKILQAYQEISRMQI